MLSTFLTVSPVFGLVFAGWLTRRVSILGAAATAELNRFVVYLALPALLFDIVAHADWAAVWHPGFVAVFGLSSVIVVVAAVAAGLVRRRSLADAAIDSLNAGYGNTGYMGLPLALVALGRDAMAPALLATIITVTVVFAIAIVLIEIGLQSEPTPARLALQVSGSVGKNPMVLAPILGALVPIFDLTLPVPMDTFLKLLGGAASPCALVALGLFLAGDHVWRREAFSSVSLLVVLKLAALPAVTWVLTTYVFRLPPLLTHTAVLMSALPTGTGPFMLAEHYRRDASVTASVILVSTVLSVLTITAYLAFAR